MSNWYTRFTSAQLKGRKVRARRSLRNGNMIIPEGALLTIERKFSGLELVSDPCPHCGVRMCITKVQPFDVDLLEERANQKELL